MVIILRLRTIIHEVTHIRDFICYAKLVGASNYTMILDASKHRMFHVWTEFNARRHGYYFVRKYSFDNLADSAQLPDIINRELPFHIGNMFKNYHSTTDGWEQIYTVVQFLGRLSVWKALYPYHFTDVMISDLIGENYWMLKMFDLLNENRELATAIDSFDNLRNILQSNFKGL